MSNTALLRVDGLRMGYRVGGAFSSRTLWAVDSVSLEVEEGSTLAVVGESGCGKSTLGRLMLGLQAPTEGTVQFSGHTLSKLSSGELRALRRHMQMVFQDPYSSLNPRMRIGDAVREPLDIHRADLPKAERKARTLKLLERVGLTAEHAQRLPAEFSGGQRQRIAIARALAAEPKLVIADEPVSALDVSIQAQIINLLADLKRERALTLVFISHDLKVVRQVADRVAVMYLGRVVELGPAEPLFNAPHHPYTRALLAAVPTLNDRRPRPVLTGELPSPLNPPSGCAFHPRCPLYATLDSTQQARCRAERPELGPKGACHFSD